MRLNISTDRVLHGEPNPVLETFNTISTPIDKLNFIDMLMKQDRAVIHENMSLLYKLPKTRGPELFNSIVEVRNDFTLSELEELITSIESYMNNTEEDMTYLNESVDLIQSKINEHETIEKLREDISMGFYTDRLKNIYVEESRLADEMEIIAYNVNHNYEIIDDYEHILRKIKLSTSTEHFSNFPMLIENNTAIILNLKNNITGDVLKLLTSMPAVIVDKLIEEKASKVAMKTISKVLTAQITRVVKVMKSADKKYATLKYYLDVLYDSKDKLDKVISSSLKEFYTAETIADMQPDIIPYEVGTVEDVTAGLDDELEYVSAELEDALVELFIDDSEDVDPALLEQIVRLSRTYEILTEDVLDKVEKGATSASQAVAKGGQKVATGARRVGGTVSKVGTAVKFAVSPIVNLVNGTIDKIKKMDKDERTERLITGKRHITLASVLRKAILALTTGAVVVGGISVLKKAPAMGWAFIKSTGFVGTIIVLIGIITGIAINKKLDLKERKRLLSEMEAELKIVEEKLEDAKSDGEREKKYELMRVKSKLEKDILRIKFNLKD